MFRLLKNFNYSVNENFLRIPPVFTSQNQAFLCQFRQFHQHNEVSIKEQDEIREFEKTFTLTSIKENELNFKFIRSSGPGGQNVNKVNSKANLSFDVKSASFLPLIVKTRLINQNFNRLNKQGELIIQSDKFRTQLMNKKECIQILFDLIARSLVLPKVTTPETKLKVESLIKRNEQKIKRDKQFKSKLKDSRKRDF